MQRVSNHQLSSALLSTIVAAGFFRHVPFTDLMPGEGERAHSQCSGHGTQGMASQELSRGAVGSTPRVACRGHNEGLMFWAYESKELSIQP